MVAVISNTCASPAMTSHNVSSEKGLYAMIYGYGDRKWQADKYDVIHVPANGFTIFPAAMSQKKAVKTANK